jgi:hypothetical protein
LAHEATFDLHGLEGAASTLGRFAAHIKSEITRFTRIAKAASIKAE